MERWIAGMLVAGSLAACGDPAASPCAGVGCSGRGFCTVRDGLPECVCLAGYHAVDLSCEPNDPTDPCLDVDCSGHGACRVEAGGPVCDCTDGWVRDRENPTRCVDIGAADADADVDLDADAETGTDAGIPTCGSGTCDPGETTENCALDCPTTAEGFSCSSALVCMECCGNTIECDGACLAATAPVDRRRAEDAEECYLANCSVICEPGWSTACNDCITDNCGAEWSACGLLPAGTAGCWTLASCLWGCPDFRWGGTPDQCATDEGLLCEDACYRAADHDAVRWSDALDDCIWAGCDLDCERGEAECTACLETHCPTALEACRTDG